MELDLISIMILPGQRHLCVEGPLLDAGASFPDDDGRRLLDRGPRVDDGGKGDHVLFARRKVDKLNKT